MLHFGRHGTQRATHNPSGNNNSTVLNQMAKTKVIGALVTHKVANGAPTTYEGATCFTTAS